MDKEHLTITIKADSGTMIGHHYADERRFEVDVTSRAEVSKLFDEITEMINAHEGWEQ